MQGKPLREEVLPLTVAIPTYRREEVLIQTIEHFLNMPLPPAEILILDQTEVHFPMIEEMLKNFETKRKIRWIRVVRPSITGAMNLGLLQANCEIVLFVDDDIVPEPGLLEAHLAAHKNTGSALIAGRVIQPWQEGIDFSNDINFHFASLKRGWISEFMGGNFSVLREKAKALGGFDENFVHVAYRFEMEFSERLMSAGGKIFFEPNATIHHLKAKDGGTRSFGEHLRTVKPSHAVGAYYYLLRSKTIRYRAIKMLGRFISSVKTRHHLHNPWWMPIMVVAELWGFLWALLLFLRGPRFIGWQKNKKRYE
jgi:GT2 family glycosyltransferase